VKHPDSFSMKLFVDFVGESTGSDAINGTTRVNVGRISKGALEQALLERGLMRITPSSKSLWSLFSRFNCPNPAVQPMVHKKNVLFLVCGPEPMIEAIAGPRPKQRKDAEQTGLLGELGYGPANVRKL